MGVTRAQAEQMLVEMHDISRDQRPALQARMRHLQRLGIPKGTNVGRGKHADYGLDGLLQLAFAFDLLDVGLTPERVRRVLGTWWFVRRAIYGSASPSRKDERLYVEVYPSALSALQEDHSLSNELEAVVLPLTNVELAARLAKGLPRPAALVDMRALFERVMEVLQFSICMPGLEGELDRWFEEASDAGNPEA